MTTLHIDVFAKRPQIQPLESFTSLLKRAMAEIGIDTVDSAVLLCFPNLDRRQIRSVNDFGLQTYDMLQTRLNQSQAVIEKTTLKHLAMKFGRSPHPQAISRFLSGTIAPTLRWCPHCLREKCYCRLPWQFEALPGCPIHQVKLRSKCSNCSQPVPFFKAPLRIDVCPYCKINLAEQATQLLTNDQVIETIAIFDDLAFLLTPQTWDTRGIQVTATVGRLLASERHKARFDMRKMAVTSGLSVTAQNGIEMAKPTLYGAPFRNYWAFARFFNLRLQDVFQRAAEQNE